MSPAYKKLLKISRLVHVYLTLFGLVLILFFSVTGFMLNHESWFLPKVKDRTLPVRMGTLPKKLLEPLDKLAVVEALRRDFGVSGFLGGDPKEYETDDGGESGAPLVRGMDELFPVPKPPDDPADPMEPVVLKFAAPSKDFDVKIWLRDDPAPKPVEGDNNADAGPKPAPKKAGDVEVATNYKGWGGVLMDLHKGKATGRAWAWVIDITCVFLVIISMTGLVLWSSLKTRGKWGLVSLLLGGLASLAVYYLGVP